MYRTLLRILLAASLLILAACGGGDSYSTANPGGGGGNVAVEGIWSGSYTVGASPTQVTIYATILKGGYAFFYDDIGTVYVLPKLTGSTMLGGTLTAYAAQGTMFANGLSVETFDVTATVSDTAITGTFTGTFGSNTETVSFNLSPFTPFGGNPSVVGGIWTGFYIGPGSTASLALHVQSSGLFVGTDGNGCNLNGTLTQVTGEDLFTVTVDSTGGPLCAGTLTGLAFESSTDDNGLFGGTTGKYYYFGVSNASAAFVAELKVP